MLDNKKYIKVEDAITVIDKAATNGIISRKSAEIVIYNIYKILDESKYKKPGGLITKD